MGILSILHLPLATIRSLDKSYCHTFCPHFGWSQWNQLKPKSGWSLAPEEEERQRMEAARITEVPRIFSMPWSKCSLLMRILGLGFTMLYSFLLDGTEFDSLGLLKLTSAHWRVLFQSGSPDIVFWRWNCDSGSNKRGASPKSDFSDSDFHQRWISQKSYPLVMTNIAIENGHL